MFLSIYYMASMLVQWLRRRPMLTSITGQLMDKASGTHKDATISFYRLEDAEADDLNDAHASSSLVSNASAARIRDTIFHQNNYRGCVLIPQQKVDLSHWITFPKESLLVPTTFDNNNKIILDETTLVRVLVEVNSQPAEMPEETFCDFIQIQHFGIPICWKAGSQIAFILDSDINNLSRLLTTTFVDGNHLMNDNLLLNRIETITTYDTPQNFESINSKLNCILREPDTLHQSSWDDHIQTLRNISQFGKNCSNDIESQLENGIAPDLIPVPQRSGSFRSNSSMDTVRSVSPRESSFEKMLDEVDNPSALQGPNENENRQITVSSNVQLNNGTTSKMPVASTSSRILVNEAKPIPKAEFKITRNLNSAYAKPTPVASVAKMSDTKIGPKIKKGISFAEIEIKETKPKEKMSDTKLKKHKEEESKSKSFINASDRAKVLVSATTSVDSVLEAAIKEIESRKQNMPKIGTVQQLEKEKEEVPRQVESSIKKSPSCVSTAKVPKVTPKPIQLPTATSIDSGTDSPTPLIQRKSAGGSMKKKIEKQKKVSDEPTRHLPSDGMFKRLPSKPMNVLVYAESSSIRTDVIETLSNILEPDRYTVYPLNAQQSKNGHFISNCSLLIVCGDVSDHKHCAELFAEFFVKGGQLLCICSDVLHHILPTYRTAEIRENELVQFSYKKWQRIRMMHHVFCYQPSPVKKHFSQDSQESENSIPKAGRAIEKSQMPMCPRSIDVKDNEGTTHSLLVEVLGKEETWNTPSLITARNKSNDGVAIFSQIHLETSPSQYEFDSSKYSVLQQNEKIRLEILSDLLATHFKVQVTDKAPKEVIYTPAYFLGRHELKFQLLEDLKPRMESSKLATKNVTLVFYTAKNVADIKLEKATAAVLPILMHSCPENFNTVEYFENLSTNEIGRLLVYAPVLASSMHIVNATQFANGFAVIPCSQTHGVGRNENHWISPIGCLMASIQLHIPLKSNLGERLSIIQHLIATAILSAFYSVPEYKDLDIGIKWPNDIYHRTKLIKMGGLVVNSQINQDEAICNIGFGINYNNPKPTISINQLLLEKQADKNVPTKLISNEKMIAYIFNEIEKMIHSYQTENPKLFFDKYYKYWMHANTDVEILDKNGYTKQAHIMGIDEYGFLTVKESLGTIQQVQPDGNSFDMLLGLISAK